MILYIHPVEDKEYYNYVKDVFVTDEESESESESETAINNNEVEKNNESDDHSEEKTKSCFSRCESTGSELNFVVA